MSPRRRTGAPKAATAPAKALPEALIEPLWVKICGDPKTKGSMRHIGHGRMVEQVSGSSGWRQRVGETLARALGTTPGPDGPVPEVAPCSTPVEVWVRFLVKGDPIGIYSGDLDKLCRCVGDAMTDAGVIEDDRLIVKWTATKERVSDTELPGCVLGVRRIDLSG